MKSLLPLLLAAALVAPAAAAADTVAADPLVDQVAALDGTIVWVTGQGPGQRLMQRAPDGEISPVAGAPEAVYYNRVDLGRDRSGRLVLTYQRCSSPGVCRYWRDDLAGNRRTFKGLAPKRCALSTTPSVWGARVAFGVGCFKRSGGRRVSDRARSGLYVKTGSGSPQRLGTPRAARRAGAHDVVEIDLRGRQVAALYRDISWFAVVQSVKGTGRFAYSVAASEGDGEQSATGLNVAVGGARMWVLTKSSYAGDPALSIIQRRRGSCDDYQTLRAPDDTGSDWDYPYVDLAVDGSAIYAADPGVGVVTHEYAPTAGGC